MFDFIIRSDSSANSSICSNPGNELVFNVLLLGYKGVGKTTFCNVYSKPDASPDSLLEMEYVPSIGIDFYFRHMIVDGFYCKLQLWDTAGQSEFMTFIHESYFRSSNCVILMYEVSDLESYNEVKLWIEHITTHCGGTAVVIVGNKSDLASQVDSEEAKSFCSDYNCEHIEISNRNRSDVEYLMNHMTKAMIVQHLRKQVSVQCSTPLSDKSNVAIVSPKKKSQEKRKPVIHHKYFREECDEFLKVLLLGEANVGKTSLMYRYTQRRFSTNYLATLGIDFENHLIDVDGKVVKLQIWDTVGQERFRSLSPQYYRGANIIIIVYDITHRNSFNQVLSWVQIIQSQKTPETVLAVVGNKCDLAQYREIDEDQGRQIAESLNTDLFIETSAKTNLNVGEVFEFLTRKVFTKREGSPNKSSPCDDLLIKPSTTNLKNIKKPSCC